MKAISIYRNLVRMALAALTPVLLCACESLKDDMDDCGLYLEFIYDHNMEFADSFTPQVPSVDVFVFDEAGKYLFSKHAQRTELISGKRMYLSTELGFGKQYNIITVGGLSDNFSFSGPGGNLTPGVTTIEEVQLALRRTANEVSHEFPGLWLGTPVQIEYKGNNRVWPVQLIKDTNRFYITLTNIDHNGDTEPESGARYTFEIETDDGAVYGNDNAPQLKETITYKPYYLQPGAEPEIISVARINTMRLLKDTQYKYSFIIRDVKTGNEVWRYDLITLLSYTKPDLRPDGTALPLQEYLDRQSEWNIVLLYREGEAPSGNKGFLGIGLAVADWIFWLNDINV